MFLRLEKVFIYRFNNIKVDKVNVSLYIKTLVLLFKNN